MAGLKIWQDLLQVLQNSFKRCDALHKIKCSCKSFLGFFRFCFLQEHFILCGASHLLKPFCKTRIFKSSFLTCYILNLLCRYKRLICSYTKNYVQMNVTEVQSINNISNNSAYHNVNRVQNSLIDALILNLFDIVICGVFALYSRIVKKNQNHAVHFSKTVDYTKRFPISVPFHK